MIFAVEPLKDCWDEWRKMTELHWVETMQWQHGKQEWNPSFERYSTYEAMGCFVMITVRDQGKLVGYCGAYVVESMHSQVKIATEDFVFLLPEYRKGRNGVRLYQFCEEEVKRRGCKEISLTVKPETGAKRLIEFMGYSLVNLQYCKHLT